jgi:hypothetical protein
MLQEEPRKDGHSERDVRHNQNATRAYGTKVQSSSYVWENQETLYEVCIQTLELKVMK